MARISAPVPQGGSVVFGGRVAQIIGFDGGIVRLRFADGRDAGVALAEYVLHARAVRSDRGPGGPGSANAMLAIPWHPTGQRARQVRRMLNGYTAGRKAALRELHERSA